MKMKGSVIFPTARTIYQRKRERKSSVRYRFSAHARGRRTTKRQCATMWDVICIKSDINVFGRWHTHGVMNRVAFFPVISSLVLYNPTNSSHTNACHSAVQQQKQTKLQSLILWQPNDVGARDVRAPEIHRVVFVIVKYAENANKILGEIVPMRIITKWNDWL